MDSSNFYTGYHKVWRFRISFISQFFVSSEYNKGDVTVGMREIRLVGIIYNIKIAVQLHRLH
jgi:hypothetical protein